MSWYFLTIKYIHSHQRDLVVRASTGSHAQQEQMETPLQDTVLGVAALRLLQAISHIRGAELNHDSSSLGSLPTLAIPAMLTPRSLSRHVMCLM
jgi:hypothetical protein